MSEYKYGGIGGGAAAKKRAASTTTLSVDEATKVFDAAVKNRESWDNERNRLNAQYDALHSNRSLSTNERIRKEEELKERIQQANDAHYKADRECANARLALRKAQDNEPILAREKQEQENKDAALKATLKLAWRGSDAEFEAVYPELRMQALQQHTLNNTNLGRTPAQLQREQMLERYNSRHTLGE